MYVYTLWPVGISRYQLNKEWMERKRRKESPKKYIEKNFISFSLEQTAHSTLSSRSFESALYRRGNKLHYWMSQKKTAAAAVSELFALENLSRKSRMRNREKSKHMQLVLLLSCLAKIYYIPSALPRLWSTRLSQPKNSRARSQKCLHTLVIEKNKWDG